MAVVNVWVGGVRPDSATVVTKVDSTADVRVAVDTSPGLSDPDFYGPTTPVDGRARVKLAGLAADTRYYFAVEHDGTLDASFPGEFRTHPTAGIAASFTMGAASCASGGGGVPGIGDVLAASQISNHPVFETILDQALADDWRGFVHMGDMHYYDLGSGNYGITGGGSLTNYRRAYDDVLLQPLQHEMYRRLPIDYIYDDHDWGPGNSTGEIEGRPNALQAYREVVPYAELAVPGAAEPNYHSFQIGRVLFVVLDCRSESDPGEAPDNAGKTMLGAAQKAWLRNLLATTTAKALVLVSSRMWDHPTADDTWAGYSFERQELIDLFGEPGVDGNAWLNRMCVVQGDGHSAGIASADGNIYGHFPVFQFAPLSSSPGGKQPWKDLGSFNETGQYGTLSFADDGDQVTVTGTAWRWTENGPIQLVSHTFVAGAEPGPGPGPGPEPGPPRIATAQIRRRVTWYGVHAVTGRIIAELPDVRGSVGRLLSAYSSHTLTMPIPLAGPGHVPIQLVEQATEPVFAGVVAVVNDLPAWMGWVLSRRGGTGAELQIATATPEAYLRRRKVRDHSFADVDRVQIAAALVGDAEDPDGIGRGLGFTVEVTLTGDLISPTYVATDRQTVYDALRELAAGGLEFTVDLDWVDKDRTSIRKILRIGPRIGKTAEVAPLFETTSSSMFESRAGSEATYELLEDSSDGRYANHVTAVAPGEGEDQPASAPAIDQAALDGGVPIIEHIADLSAADTGASALATFAAAELTRLRRGAEVWDISTRLDAYPRLGVDAQIGDDVSWLLTGHRHPTGVLGRGRMIGFELDEQEGRWRPVLLQPGEEVGG